MDEQQTQVQVPQVPNIQDSLPIPPPIEGGTLYVPSSIQKKRALMMYLLIGIVMVLNEKKTNEFEYFHLKQAIGWRMGFLVLLLLAVLLLFIPYIKALGFFVLMGWMVTLVYFLKQARDGIYKRDLIGYWAAVFPSLGNWVVSLFDLYLEDQQQTPNT